VTGLSNRPFGASHLARVNYTHPYSWAVIERLKGKVVKVNMDGCFQRI